MKQEGTPQPPRVLCATENNTKKICLPTQKEKHTSCRSAVTLNIQEFILVHWLFLMSKKNELQEQRSQS